MSELQGIVRFTFHEGGLEEFKRLSAECMEIVRAKEPGTIQYDTYLNADQSKAVTLERFRDSDALVRHSENLAHLMDAILATGTCEGELLGEPSEQLRTMLDGSPVGLFFSYQLM